MKTALRVINILLMLLIVFGAAGMAVDSGVAQAIGASIWIIPAFLAFRALGDGHERLAGAAFIANLVAIAGVVVVIIVIDEVDAAATLGVVLISLPFLLNVWGVRRHQSQVRKAASAAMDEIPLLPEDEAFGTPSHEPSTSAPPQAEISRALPAPAGTPATAASAPKFRSSNYFVRHWHGELALPISYWVNGSLVGVALWVAISMVGLAMGDQSSIRVLATFGVVAIVLVLVASVWSPVGIWRSASRHAARGGSQGWATTAQVMTVVGILGSATTVTNTLWPQLKEYSMIAVGHDRFGRIDATVTTNGSAIVLKGMFGAGSAEDVRRLLDQVPGAKTLVLDSAGGRLHEALLIANLARDRELNTYVETHCESACTYIFLAGQDRAATPNARIGFHRPSFPGMNEIEMTDATQDMLNVYRTAGVDEAFLKRVEETRADEMWYPTRDELIDSRVINRVSLGGETAREATSYRSKSELELAFRTLPVMLAVDERFPGTIDEAVVAAWEANQEGAHDSEINTVARRIIMANYGKLVRIADDELINDLVQLSVDQMLAAQAVSEEACARLARSELDVVQVLPKELVDREQIWLMKVLRSPEREVPTVSDAQMETALAPLFELLEEDSLLVLAEPEKYKDLPGHVCNANLDLLVSLSAMPPKHRASTFRTLQAAAEQ